MATIGLQEDTARRAPGFTVVELVVVVGIIVVLAGITYPIIHQYMPTYHLKQAARQIVSQMQLARINAIRNGVRTVAVFSPAAFTPAGGAGSFKIYEDDNRNGAADATDNNWVQDSGEATILQDTTMPKDVTLVTAVFTDNGSGQADATRCYGYDPRGVAAWAVGGATPVTGTVQLQNAKNETRTIMFHASGKVEIQ